MSANPLACPHPTRRPHGTSTPIADHGLIGDLQTSALVSAVRHFSVRPETEGYVTWQLYLPGTAMLITRFLTPEGVGEVCDSMPVIEGGATDRHRIVRLLRVVRGEMTFALDCQPRFDHGRRPHKMEITDEGVAFRGDDGLELALYVSRRPGVAPHDAVRPIAHGEGVRAVLTATAGQIGAVVLESAPEGPPRLQAQEEVLALFTQTRGFWSSWVSRSSSTGRWREDVERSR